MCRSARLAGGDCGLDDVCFCIEDEVGAVNCHEVFGRVHSLFDCIVIVKCWAVTDFREGDESLAWGPQSNGVCTTSLPTL